MDKNEAIGELGKSLYEFRYREIVAEINNRPKEDGIMGRAKELKAAAEKELAPSTAKTFAGTDLASLTLEMNKAGTVQGLITHVAERSNNVKIFTDAFVQKWKQDPKLIEKLEADLKKDPAMAKRLEDALISDQAKGAQILKGYNGGNLGILLPAQTAKPEPVAAVATPTPTAPIPQTRTASAASAAPATPAATNPDIVIPPPPGGAVDQSATRAEVLKSLVDMKPEEIAAQTTPDLVKSLVDGVAQKAAGLGVSENLVGGFTRSINDDPKMLKAVTDNIRNNPEFVRELAKMSLQKGEPDEGIKKVMRKKMEEIMENPQNLAKDGYVKNLTSTMKNAGMLNGMGSFVQNTFGIDMSGAMGGMGGFFQSIMQWFQDFMGAFNGGAVEDFLSSPSKQGLGMFDKLSVGIGFAMQHANNAYHSPYEKEDLTVLPDEQGTFFRTEKITKKNEKGEDITVERDVPNTIELVGANGEKHQVIPTAGPMQFTPLPTGNNTVSIRMATGAKLDEKTGKPVVTKTGDFVITRQEYDRLKAELAMKGSDSEYIGVRPGPEYRSVEKNMAGAGRYGQQAGNPSANASPENTQPTAIRVTSVDPKTGQVGDTVQTFPVNQDKISTRPLDPLKPEIKRPDLATPGIASPSGVGVS